MSKVIKNTILLIQEPKKDIKGIEILLFEKKVWFAYYLKGKERLFFSTCINFH